MLKTIFLALGLGALAPALAISAEKGPETGLDLPRYVSLKAAKANVRRGPSLSHRVDWEFLRRGMPLQITAEFGHWRRVRDMDDATGWVHYSLLSGHRTAIVLGTLTALHDDPREDSGIGAYVEQGVVVELDACTEGWCEVEAEGYSGWLPKAEIWGVDRDEVFD
jgi:SH3-like domain-containing protein